MEGRASQGSVRDAPEARSPVLRGTIRDHVTQQHRPVLSCFACAEDLSHELPDALLPDAVASGAAPFFVVRASAAGRALRSPLFDKKCRGNPIDCMSTFDIQSMTGTIQGVGFGSGQRTGHG
jgi:sulfur-carrier protein